MVPNFSSFIKKDYVILRKHFSTRIHYFRGLKSLPKFFKFLKNILWADITISRFANGHAYRAVLFSKIFKKKSIVVVGGYEVANLPQINYGLARSKKSRKKVKYTLEHADKVVTVSESLIDDAFNNIKINRNDIEVVPNGYDHELFKPLGKKGNLALTVSYCHSWRRYHLKGMDIFLKTATQLPHVNFLMVGINDKMLKEIQGQAPPNVSFLKGLPTEKLVSIYQKAKVYCQLSMREGHPNALSEAMLCECVPVGTKTPGIQNVIGDTGFYAPFGDVEKTIEAIQKALKSNKGTSARKRIQTLFPLGRREKELVEIIKGVDRQKKL